MHSKEWLKHRIDLKQQYPRDIFPLLELVVYSVMHRSPLEFWEQYDSSDMKLNPAIVENAQNRKEVTFREWKNIKEGDWKSSDIDLSIKAALDFTEASSSELVFSLPVNVAER